MLRTFKKILDKQYCLISRGELLPFSSAVVNLEKYMGHSYENAALKVGAALRAAMVLT
jgi:hypothetical protein